MRKYTDPIPPSGTSTSEGPYFSSVFNDKRATRSSMLESLRNARDILGENPALSEDKAYAQTFSTTSAPRNTVVPASFSVSAASIQAPSGLTGRTASCEQAGEANGWNASRTAKKKRNNIGQALKARIGRCPSGSCIGRQSLLPASIRLPGSGSPASSQTPTTRHGTSAVRRLK